MKKIILYELNEVSLEFILRYVNTFKNSNFAKLAKKTNLIKTINRDKGHLSPWITWPTLHRGVNNDTHLISDFNQNLGAINEKYPTIMDILIENGINVGVFGSLHSYPLPADLKNYKFYVPDTFAENSKTHPEVYKHFQILNISLTKINGKNVVKKINIKSAIKFMFFSMYLGLKLITVLKIFKQLILEFFYKHIIIRRRVIQSEISFDLFYKLLCATKPMFVTYFTNHVASSMHRYWPATFPDDYSHFKMDSDWIKKYKNEIWNSMHIADEQIGKLLEFIAFNNEYSLIIASSMGQRPVQESTIMKNMLKIINVKKFFDFFEIDEFSYEQKSAMMPQYIFTFNNKYVMDEFVTKLSNLYINNMPIDCKILEDYTIRIHLLYPNQTEGNCISNYDGSYISLSEFGVDIVDIQDQTGTYAYHIPEGFLCIHNYCSEDPADLISEELTIDTIDVAPSILANFGVKVPLYMSKNKFEI